MVISERAVSCWIILRFSLSTLPLSLSLPSLHSQLHCILPSFFFPSIYAWVCASFWVGGYTLCCFWGKRKRRERKYRRRFGAKFVQPLYVSFPSVLTKRDFKSCDLRKDLNMKDYKSNSLAQQLCTNVQIYISFFRLFPFSSFFVLPNCRMAV